MKKTVTRALSLLLGLSLAASMAACSDFSDPKNEGEKSYTFAQTDTYLNGQDIEGQWGSDENSCECPHWCDG